MVGLRDAERVSGDLFGWVYDRGRDSSSASILQQAIIGSSRSDRNDRRITYWTDAPGILHRLVAGILPPPHPRNPRFSAPGTSPLKPLIHQMADPDTMRKTNAPYVAWVTAFNATFLLGYYLIERYGFEGGVPQEERVPRLLAAMNKNGLVVFLVVCTFSSLTSAPQLILLFIRGIGKPLDRRDKRRDTKYSYGG